MNPRNYVFGISVRCAVCDRTKKPRGRSAPIETASSLCDDDCRGYDSDPKPGDLWPGESEKDFGYPVGQRGIFVGRGE